MVHHELYVEIIDITQEEFDELQEMQEQNPPFRFSLQSARNMGSDQTRLRPPGGQKPPLC